MKKHLFLSSTAIAAAALTAFFCYKSFTPQLSEADILLNENIEALTNGEDQGNMSECSGHAIYSAVEYAQGKQKLRLHYVNGLDNEVEVTYKRCYAYGRGKISGFNGDIDISFGAETFIKCEGDRYHKYFID